MDTVFVAPAPRLAVSVAGNGELVLFLHGIRGNRRNWAGQVEFFSQRFKAAAWDARGYGDSDDYDGPLQFEYFTGDVMRVAEHFKAAKLHLIGLSMGGRIARNVALRAPERLQSLVLISTNPGFDAMSPESVKRFITERRNATPQTLRRLLGSKPNHAAYQELLDSVSRIHEVSYQKTLEASVAQDRAAPIEQIRVPTLVVAGEEDTVYPPELAREMAQRIPGAELLMFERTGHLANLEQPERFNKAVLDFLSRHAAR
ncbi:MAG TPA: alpha/beta fold hydrolase [Burkholderiales bacterium]|nr:alpha/beta fold hydrolase [Burkholderiales bacterium]